MERRTFQRETETSAFCYAGYRFVNQLEARWAVFFDALGVEWEHPRARFTLPRNQFYLPDFWLPRQQCWVAVSEEHPGEEALMNAADLAFTIHKWVAVVWGEVGKHHIYAFYPPFYEQGYYKRYVFSLCDHCHQMILAHPLSGEEGQQLMGYCYECQDMVMQKADTFFTHARLLRSYSTARQVHFEQEPVC